MFVIEDDKKSVNYFQQISENREVQYFTSPWGGCILRNCNDTGDILEVASISEYEKLRKESNTRLWLYLRLKVFKFNGMQLYGVFVCNECESMSALEGLESSQDPEDIRPKLCLHSLVASMLTGDWRRIWNVSLSPSDQMFNVCCNQEDNFATFIPQSSETALLAGVMDKKSISILYCTTSRQEHPFCTNCVRRKCHHYRKLVAFYATQGGEELGNEAQFEEEFGEYEPRHDVSEEDFGFEDHYMKAVPNHIRGHLYGYNFTEIRYPFSDSSEQQQIWLDKMKGSTNIPKCLVPVFDAENKCMHKVPFKCSNDSLVKESQNLCLFNDLGERFVQTEVFARPSDGPCSCLQRYDGHPLQIWNLGRGRFVDYTLLLGYLHKWRASGISMHALYRSIVDCAESCGVSCSLTYSDIHRSVCGFFTNLVFNIEKAFSCPTHGTSPSWIVSDGKSLGPLKRNVKHLSELDIAEEDDSVLSQSTHYQNRIFLSVKKERVEIVKLLTGDITMEEFTLTQDITTENGILVINLVGYIN